ncbi:MAG: inorganic diphosphatase [Pseudomonadota bacterium]
MTTRPDLSWLGRRCHVTVDRALGSAHPRFPELRYPVNYGYIEGTRAGDGLEIDAYILGVDEPIEAYTGLCIAVIHRKDDREDKLVVARSPICRRIICQETDFIERFFETEIFLWKNF